MHEFICAVKCIQHNKSMEDLTFALILDLNGTARL